MSISPSLYVLHSKLHSICSRKHQLSQWPSNGLSTPVRESLLYLSYQREPTKCCSGRDQPILCFPPRDVPIEDIYSYTIPIPPEYSSGQVTKEYQDWEDSQWIHASNLSKHGDPTRTVVTCPRRSTSGHGDHLSVIVGPLVKQVPQRWPRKMFRHERFTPYPFYAGKDPHARDTEIVTWRKKLRAKAERKDARGRPLTWVQIEPQNDGVMIRWRNRLGVRSRKEEKSHCDVSRKSGALL